jgi:hypothetical protein
MNEMEKENHYSWEEMYYLLRCAIPYREERKFVNVKEQLC